MPNIGLPDISNVRIGKHVTLEWKPTAVKQQKVR